MIGEPEPENEMMIPEEMVPQGRRSPELFRGQGVRGHRYHVFNEPKYWQWKIGSSQLNFHGDRLSTHSGLFSKGWSICSVADSYGLSYIIYWISYWKYHYNCFAYYIYNHLISQFIYRLIWVSKPELINYGIKHPSSSVESNINIPRQSNEGNEGLEASL